MEGLAKPLEITVNVIQLSSGNDLQMLIVEGQLGAFDYTVPGQGAEISLQVITGSPASQWKAEADKDLGDCVSSYTPQGANKGFLKLSFRGNVGTPRQGTLTVKRLLSDGNEDTSVDPVIVTFKQDKSPYVVSLMPNYSVNGLTIDAFQAGQGTPNGIVQKIQFSVLLVDPDHYKFTATCSFNKESDAFISRNVNMTATAGPLQTSKLDPSSIEGTDGESVWLHVFRMGPGDADITGNLTVKAVPKDPTSGFPEATYSVPITIKTSCKIGDSKIDTLLWADRNVGAIPRGEGGAPVGLNYTNDATSDDYGNMGFRGGYYTFTQAQGVCATFGTDNRYEGELVTGWRVPTKDEQIAVSSRIYFSKQRGYIVSDDKIEGTVGCWLPLSGSTTIPNEIAGYFWSSTPNFSSGYCLSVTTGSANASSSYYQPYGYSVRCVRDI